MDAMIRNVLILLLISSGIVLHAQQMNWSRLAGDTIYYANEYMPDDLFVTPPGPGQVWDFRSLRAPYSLSRSIIVTGNHDNTTYANIVNGKQTDAILQISGNLTQMVQVFEDNPICPGNRLVYNLYPAFKPFYNGELGADNTYHGRMQSIFAWPRDRICSWVPAQLPDSCRISFTISDEITVDGEGTLYLPTEVTSVMRQHILEKRILKIELKKGRVWSDVTRQIPGLKIVTSKENLRFVSTDSGLEWVDIELNENLTPLRVEFKTYPLVTRVFVEEPSRPDIFAYPNPTFDVVRFQLSDLPYGHYKLKIFNILGVQVKEIEVDVDDPRKTVSVDLGEFQRGTYLYRLQDNLGRTIRTKRIILIKP